MLKEYGYQFVPIANYNGILADSNIVDANALRMLYASLLSGNVAGAVEVKPTDPTGNIVFQIDNSQLPSFEQLNSNMYAALQSSATPVNPVTIMMIKYNSISPTAIDDGLLTINNNQLYDVANRTQSPYIMQTAFAAAQQSNECNTGTVNLLFKPELFFTNLKNVTVSSIQVNFDDGNGFVPVSFGTIASATYSSTGEKRLTFSVTLSNGQNLQCYSRLFVSYVPPPNPPSRYANTTIPTQVFAPTGLHSGGDAFVQFSVLNTSPAANRRFRRPLIVVEGFDIHDAAPTLSQGYTYRNFWDEITNGDAFFGVPVRSFNENLDDVAGYDLIFINYRDGTDDIRRNAALLQEVIEWVNANKDGLSEQNVVLGISMGGLVARYCLANMTKQNNNPQTRMLITHDSPHRGANIPLGVQYLLYDISTFKIRLIPFTNITTSLKDVIPALGEFNNLRSRPATQQQLLALVTANGLTQNTFLDGEYRDMITFPVASPPPYQFVATSQGSQCGTPLFQPYSLLANGGGTGSVSAPLLGLFGTQSTAIDLQLHALPNFGEVQNIAHLKLTMSLNILLWTRTITLLEYNRSSSANMFPWDGVAGGVESLSRGGVSGLPATGKGKNFFGFFNYNYRFNGLQVQNAFTFVPIVSSLDVQNINAFDQPYIFANNGQNGSRATEYIAEQRVVTTTGQIANKSHTDFTFRNANWIFNEIENNGQNGLLCCQAPNECVAYSPGNMTMTGVGVVCNSVDYSIANLPPNSVVQWSVADGNGFVFQLTPGGVNGSILTVTNLHTQNLATTLVASVVTPQGGPIILTKPIFADNDNGTYYTEQLGCPPFRGTYQNMSIGQSRAMNICYYMKVHLGNLAAAGKTVSLNNNVGPVDWFYDGNLLQIHFNPATAWATFRISGQEGSCSQGNLTFYSIGIHRVEFDLNPNPVNDILTISARLNPNQPNQDAGFIGNLLFTTKITNLTTGLVVRTIQSLKGSTQQQINMSGLSSGYYVVEITEGDQVQTFKVLKQ